jgi:hypothetical protein
MRATLLCLILLPSSTFPKGYFKERPFQIGIGGFYEAREMGEVWLDDENRGITLRLWLTPRFGTALFYCWGDKSEESEDEEWHWKDWTEKHLIGLQIMYKFLSALYLAGSATFYEYESRWETDGNSYFFERKGEYYALKCGVEHPIGERISVFGESGIRSEKMDRRSKYIKATLRMKGTLFQGGFCFYF